MFRIVFVSFNQYSIDSCVNGLLDSVPSAIAGPQSSAKYLGCYADRADVKDRALPMVQEVSKTMTVQQCLDKCESLGFAYAGLEYKHECYCGNQPPAYEKLLEEQCSTECGGGGVGTCGGALSLSVYEQLNIIQPTINMSRPLVCLVMILKDEAHTILDTLKAVKDHIDCYHILDTGSTDGTADVIKKFFTENPSTLPGPLNGQIVPGQVYFEPFIDYGATRNRILDLSDTNSAPIFNLMLSADEHMRNANDMRNFLSSVRFAQGNQHGAYPVLMDTGLKFVSMRLSRGDSKWRYKGRVHEYLAPPGDQPYGATYQSPIPIDVFFKATDGPRRFQSQFYIKRILEEDVVRNPNDTRAMFYLARTNSGINNHTEAFKYYSMLSERSKWDEEIYHGMVMKAIESKFLEGFDWRERQKILLDAFHYRSNNMDALYTLAQDHYDSGRFQLAFLFAQRAVQLPLPPNLHSIENVLLRPTKWLYDYEGNRLLGFAAREIKEWDVCVKAFQAVLKFNTKDTIVEDRIKLCVTEAEKLGKFIQPDVHPEANDHGNTMKNNANDAHTLRIPGDLNPINKLALARRGKSGENTGHTVVDVDSKLSVVSSRSSESLDDLSSPEMVEIIREYRLRHGKDHPATSPLSYYSTSGVGGKSTTIHLDVSINYLALTAGIFVTFLIVLLWRKVLCVAADKKLKD